MIRTECHTVDDAMKVEFDATPWFQEADDQSIFALVGRDWSGDWIADALETRPGYEQLRELLRYARDRLRQESLENPSYPTFICKVASSDALAWLQRNRPSVADRFRSA